MHWIRDLEPAQRPRERLFRQGPDQLTDVELVAVLLRTGGRGGDALSAAHQLLAGAGGLAGLARLEPSELLRQPGVGPAKAASLAAALELAQRLAQARLPRQATLDSPANTASFLLPRLSRRRTEVVGIVSVDDRHRFLRCRDLVNGTRTSAPVDPAELFRSALLDGAAGVIVFHNHPSGDPSPSRDDLELTRRLVAAGEVVGVLVHDHLIVAGHSWVSLRTSHPQVFAS